MSHEDEDHGADRLDRLERGIDELRKAQQQTDRQLSNLGKKIGDLTGGWGRLVEGLVTPGVVKTLQERGYDVRGFSQESSRRNGTDEHMEIDLIVKARSAEGDEVLVAVEIKSFLQAEDVRRFVGHLDRFFEFFPEYHGRQLYGAVAGATIGDGADRFAFREGLYVFKPYGDTAVMTNEAGFEPRDFSVDG